MDLSPLAITTFLSSFGYPAAFAAMFLAGPVGDVLAGVLAGAGVFNPWIIIALAIIADVATDIFYYELGRMGGRKLLSKFQRWFHWPESLIMKAEKHFEAHGRKTLLIVKFSHGVGTITQILAGIAHMPRRKYIVTNIIGGSIQSTLLVLIGILAGSSWQIWLERFENVGQALTFAIALGIILLVGYFVVIQKVIRKNLE